MRGEFSPANSLHLRKSENGVAPCGIATCDIANNRISDLCKKFRVSRATIYRHLKRGTLPAVNRLTGRDGKTYPAGGRGQRIGYVEKNLRQSIQALRRADAKACCDGFNDVDISALRKIVSAAMEILNRWQEVET